MLLLALAHSSHTHMAERMGTDVEEAPSVSRTCGSEARRRPLRVLLKHVLHDNREQVSSSRFRGEGRRARVRGGLCRRTPRE